MNGNRITCVAVALALLAASATSCGEKEQVSQKEIAEFDNTEKATAVTENMEELAFDYIAKAIEMTKNMAERASDSSFASMYSAQPSITDEIISRFARVDYKKPNKIYRLEFDAEKIITAETYNSNRGFIDAYLASKTLSAPVAERINDASCWRNSSFVSNVLADTESFIMPADFETDFALYLDYDYYDSLVGFEKSGENIITASLSMVCPISLKELEDLFGDDWCTFEKLEISSAEFDYTAKATEMTANMAELASDSSFAAAYSVNTEITDLITDFAMGDYEKPNKVYRLEFDAEKIITAVVDDGMFNMPVDPLLKNRFYTTRVDLNLAQRSLSAMVAAHINFATDYTRLNYLSAVLAETESFVMPADFETDFALFLDYDEGFDSLVGFEKTGENIITANMSVVFDNEFPERLADLFGDDCYTFEEIE